MTVEMWSDYLGEGRRVEITDPNGDVQVLVRGEKKETPEGGIHHAIAAVALHGKSFGFTAADIQSIRLAIDEGGSINGISDEGIRELESIAQRIEALLCPAEVSA